MRKGKCGRQSERVRKGAVQGFFGIPRAGGFSASGEGEGLEIGLSHECPMI